MKDKLGVAPGGLIEGENGAINYDPGNIIEIVNALDKLVEAHEEGFNLFNDPYMGPERTMLMRVIMGKGDLYTVAWFRHEVAEARALRGKSSLSGESYRQAQEQAHIDTLTAHGNASFNLYHPSVVRAYDGQFSPLFPRK